MEYVFYTSVDIVGKVLLGNIITYMYIDKLKGVTNADLLIFFNKVSEAICNVFY